VLAALVLAPGSKQVAANGADRRFARCSYRPNSAVRLPATAPPARRSHCRRAIVPTAASRRCLCQPRADRRSRPPDFLGATTRLNPAAGSCSTPPRVSMPRTTRCSVSSTTARSSTPSGNSRPDDGSASERDRRPCIPSERGGPPGPTYLPADGSAQRTGPIPSPGEPLADSGVASPVKPPKAVAEGLEAVGR